jgi:EAL domain-containing protein (putative c-di-GMP-specific phosphodiesterase class I)/GGDEF domain-containing protein
MGPPADSRGVRAPGTPRSGLRLFATHAAVSAVPVLLLGMALAFTYRTEARDRGLAQGTSKALLLAQAGIEPLLDGRPLSEPLTSQEDTNLHKLVNLTSNEGQVLRLRLRDLSGSVVFSDDGSGFAGAPDDEALDAAKGETVALVTNLNTDTDDSGPKGVPAVEVYVPIKGSDGRPVGVLEAYLPYGPINDDVNAALSSLYRNLVLGLAALYIALFFISLSVSRGLRRQVAINGFMAEHDTLTGLPNRTLFLRRAQAALREADVNREPVTIAIIDLDRFKEVNDTLGHHNGDQVLVALRAVIDREVEVSGLPLSLEASIGYVVAPFDGVAVDELLQHADVAMYMAKAKHLGIVRYDPRHDHYDASKLELVAQLRHAIDDGQLVLHYQPKESLIDGRVDAVEALVRWQHPTHGLLYPDSFLPLAEQTDLIDKLTDWVLARALIETNHLRVDNEPLGVAVNVSARNLSSPDFADVVIGTLRRLDIAAGRLIIEITETSLLADPLRAASTLARISDFGVRISLDDFGSGQTSLGYLSALPIHELKIDKSFVTDMLVNPAHAAIVRSIVDLGHNLSLSVVGEGVETEDTLTMLRHSGCDIAQGFLMARPMPADRLPGWLLSRAEQVVAAKT